MTATFELKVTSLIFERKANKVKAEWTGELRKMVFGESNHREINKRGPGHCRHIINCCRHSKDCPRGKESLLTFRTLAWVKCAVFADSPTYKSGSAERFIK